MTVREPEPCPAAVRVRDLAKVFQVNGVKVAAVRGVDLTVRPGEFVAVMGPSGSGKSTLLHLVGGLYPPTRGDIWIRGRRVTGLGQSGWAMLRREHVGFVFQTFNLISNMTVADNVELPALVAGAGSRKARERREYLLDELGIADRARVSPAQLSGGEQQRVALARALANEPTILLADEPTGNLDSRNTGNVLRLLTTVHAQGQTILLVTHDAKVASMADRVVTLFDGMVSDDADIDPAPRPAVPPILDLRG